MLRSSNPLICVLIGAILTFAGCSSEQPESESAQAPDPYADWKTYTYNNFVIHYPEAHPREQYVAEMAQIFPALMRRDAQFLRIPAPTDTIHVYYYTGVGHGDEITGTIYPHVADSATIHFWLPGNYGPLMAKLMILRWQNTEPRFEFLKHGLLALLDFTGVNYHEKTMTLIDLGKFIPLNELAADTSGDEYFETEPEKIQAAEAASFVDFLVFRYGSDALNAMYRADAPFDQVVQGMFSISVDSLETLWLNFVPQAANPEQLLDTLQKTQ